MDYEKKVDFLVELNFKENEKVKISPFGNVSGVDGRVFIVDEETIKKTITNNIDIVINENHGYSESKAKATGWIDVNSIEVREDGVYASINWTFLGKELIDKKLYRYLSPEYVMDRNSTDRRVLYICGLGLVNSPNLLDKALNSNSKEDGKEEQLDKDKLQELQEEIGTLKAELNSKDEEIKELNTKLAKEIETNHFLNVDLAVERNKILPAQVEFCKELNSSQLSKFIESNSVNIGELTKEIETPAEKGAELNAVEQNICKQLGISEKEYIDGNS